MNTLAEVGEWQAVARVAELNRNPLQVYFKGKPVVLFRGKSSINALRDQCPHRGLPLSKGSVNDGDISCVYHGWQFNGSGELTSMPGNPQFCARAQLVIESFDILEEAGIIWLKDKKTSNDQPFIPSFHYTHNYITATTRVNANIVDVIENFLDPLHTHTIHNGIIRSKHKKRHSCEVRVTNVENGYQAVYLEEKRQSGLISRLFGQYIIKSIGRVRSSGVIEVEYHSLKGVELAVVIYINEETANHCKLIMRCYLRKRLVPFWLQVLILFPLQFIAFRQDKRILEMQAKAQACDPAFRPIVTHCDVMRPYIDKALRNDIEAVDKTLVLAL